MGVRGSEGALGIGGVMGFRGGRKWGSMKIVRIRTVIFCSNMTKNISNCNILLK